MAHFWGNGSFFDQGQSFGSGFAKMAKNGHFGEMAENGHFSAFLAKMARKVIVSLRFWLDLAGFSDFR